MKNAGIVRYLVVVGLALFVWLVYKGFTYEDCGENLSAGQVRFSLPRGAADISFYSSHNNRAYEFSSTEAAFLEWCASRGWNPKPIDEPVRMTRYTRFITDYSPELKEALSRDHWGTEELKLMDEYHAIVYAEISEGWYYRTVPDRSGRGIHVAFDAENDRAYYHYIGR